VKAKTRVLDAYSLIAYLEAESGSDRVMEHIQAARDGGRDLLLSVINWGEVYYITLRELGQKQADEVARVISTLPIQIVDVDMATVRQAATYKAGKKMSYADCIAAATAKLQKAELVTGDKDFKQVEDEVQILWIA
jgi:predicted nucleic acid-binding protein